MNILRLPIDIKREIAMRLTDFDLCMCRQVCRQLRDEFTDFLEVIPYPPNRLERHFALDMAEAGRWWTIKHYFDPVLSMKRICEGLGRGGHGHILRYLEAKYHAIKTIAKYTHAIIRGAVYGGWTRLIMEYATLLGHQDLLKYCCPRQDRPQLPGKSFKKRVAEKYDKLPKFILYCIIISGNIELLKSLDFLVYYRYEIDDIMDIELCSALAERVDDPYINKMINWVAKREPELSGKCALIYLMAGHIDEALAIDQKILIKSGRLDLYHKYGQKHGLSETDVHEEWAKNSDEWCVIELIKYYGCANALSPDKILYYCDLLESLHLTDIVAMGRIDVLEYAVSQKRHDLIYILDICNKSAQNGLWAPIGAILASDKFLSLETIKLDNMLELCYILAYGSNNWIIMSKLLKRGVDHSSAMDHFLIMSLCRGSVSFNS